MAIAVRLHNRRGEVVGYTLVDEADYEIVSQFRWYQNAGYVRAFGDGRLLHRMLLGLTESSIETDHKNGDGLDNRRSNLRIASHAENMQNRPSHRNAKSRFRGVHPVVKNGRRKWRARLRLNRKDIHIGYFKDEEAAGRAVADERLRLMPFATS